MGIIINQPVFGSIYVVANNFEELRAVETIEITDGVAAIVTGALAVGDGQGGLFGWVSSSTDADDDDAVIAPNTDQSVPGRWLRLNPIRAEDGIDGTDGIDGVSPLPPVFAVGTVTALPAGTPPTATVTGTSPAFLVNFGIPAGTNGINGTNGTNGINGTNGTNAIDPVFSVGSVSSLPAGNAPTVSLGGTYPNRIISFGLTRGADGTNGVSPTIGSVSTNTLPAGSSAAVTVNPVGGNTYNFDFSIPRGATGPAGAGSGDMLKSENLSGLASIPSARSNLGLGSAAVASTGTGSGNVPILDGAGKLPTSTIPPIAVDEKFVVPSQSAMLALTAQIGDIAIRTDQSSARYMLIDADATALANWTRLLQPTDVVTSLGGATGDITYASLISGAGLARSGTNTDITSIAGSAATLTNARTLIGTGDASFSIGPFNGSTNVSAIVTLPSVNGNTGVYGSATAVPSITVNGKGLVTAVSSVTITPAFASVTGKPTTLTGYGITDAQPINANLTNLAAIGSTSSLAYRGSDGVWRAATLGTNLSIGGTLSAPILNGAGSTPPAVHPGYISGRSYSPARVQPYSAQGTILSGYTYAQMIVIHRPVSVAAIRIASGADQSAGINGSIYSDNGSGKPDALIASANSVQMTASGTTYSMTINSPPLLTPGVYWLAVRPNDTASVFVAPGDALYAPLHGTTQSIHDPQNFLTGVRSDSITGFYPSTFPACSFVIAPILGFLAQ